MKFAANLKCNHTRQSFIQYANELNKCKFSDEIFVFPPASAFLPAQNCKNFIQGAQNFYPVSNGSFTGEIGSQMLDEFGINCVLIAHSERRILGEDEEFLKLKFNYAKSLGWKIIYCIGEDDIVYMNANTTEFLQNQLESIDLSYENLILAYEPIWAIGTGKSANIKQIEKILEFLKKQTNAPLFYGGSVNDTNIKDIAGIECCDGVLVGTASWKVENFIKLIASV